MSTTTESPWQPQPEPATPLGVLRVLSPRAGIRVSPLQLGAMSIGDTNRWTHLMGDMSRESSYKLLDAFVEAGGNFIDTANHYQDGTSEMIIGEWMEERSNRDELVLATKYSAAWRSTDKSVRTQANFSGNSMKSLRLSVESSLKQLKTTYVDILYLHAWDWECGIEEVMDGLDICVKQGKVLYLGVSDTPAWIVSKANMYARLTGKTPFVIYQGCWNIMDRSFERDIIPMAKAEGLALAPWNVLAGGKLRTDADEQARLQTGENGRDFAGTGWERNEEQKRMSRALEKVALEVGVGFNIHAVAIAYLLQRTPYVFPIIGGRKIEHLKSNIEALSVVLSDEQVKFLEGIIVHDPGFPASLIGNGETPSHFLTMAGHWQKVPRAQAIRPTQKA